MKVDALSEPPTAKIAWPPRVRVSTTVPITTATTAMITVQWMPKTPPALGIERPGELGGHAAEQQFAVIRLVHPGEHLDECRLPGAVLAHQGEALAGPHREVHGVEGGDAGESLRDAAGFEHGHRGSALVLGSRGLGGHGHYLSVGGSF